MDESNGKPGAQPDRPWLKLLLGAAPLLAALLVGVALTRQDPDLVARTVDWMRGIVGPGPVAAIENTYYQAADVYNRLHYRIAGDSSGWKLAEVTPAPSAGPTAIFTPASGQSRPTPGTGAPTPPEPGSARATPQAPGETAVPCCLGDDQPEGAVRGETAATSTGEPLHPLQPAISNPQMDGEGAWQPLRSAGQTAGDPVLWQTVYRPDPARPFAHIAVVAMDLTRSRLHLVIGTQEPVSKMAPRDLRSGMMPADDMTRGLLAAWNGGFRAVHGHYGMMTNGVVWLPAIDGMATVALARDGHVEMGAWGRGINPSGDWLAWRQNNPPLIEDTKINPDVIKFANTIRWGASIDGAVFIWRSGIGLSAGRRWLFYAVGNSLSVETLTAGLAAAGCADAMQLDVNATYERFVTFQAMPQTVRLAGKDVTLPLTAQRLIDQMQGGPAQFLAPYERELFLPDSQRKPTLIRAWLQQIAV